MRVDGDVLRWPYTRFGFSPQAIFKVGGAPGNCMSVTLRPGCSLSVTPWPPTKLAEPGSTRIVVMPEASARDNAGSCGQTPSAARTLAVTGRVASLPSAFAMSSGMG
jgi:hypothetical protein